MKVTKLIFKLFLLSLVFISCNEDTKEIEVDRGFEDGFLISSEGNFGAKDGSVSLFSDSKTNVFYYNDVNGAKLGGLVQSLTIGDDYVYVILNDANQIVVVNKETFEKEATIETGLGNPRYMVISGDKGYVTNWGEGSSATDDYVAVVDLSTNTVEATISLAEGVEQIVSDDVNLYVSHKGGWSTGNTVSVVNINSKEITSIELDYAPDELFFSNAGELVVLCQGKTEYNPDWSVKGISTSSINFINVATNEITKTIDFEENANPSLLSYDANEGDIYYYVNNGVYAIEDDATELSDEVIYEDSLFGMSVKNGNIYALKYAFTTLSTLSIIDAESKSTVFETAVGLGASKVYFLE